MGVKQQKSQTELAFMSAGEVKPELELEEGRNSHSVLTQGATEWIVRSIGRQ